MVSCSISRTFCENMAFPPDMNLNKTTNLPEPSDYFQAAGLCRDVMKDEASILFIMLYKDRVLCKLFVDKALLKSYNFTNILIFRP